jgi:hypothetical protein
MKYIILFILCATLSGCDIQSTPSEFKSTNSTPLNSILTEEVGTTITEFQSGFFVDAVKITKGTSAKSVSASKSIEVGEIYYPGNKVNNTQYYFLPYSDPRLVYGISINESTGLQKYREGDAYNLISYDVSTPFEYQKLKSLDKRRAFIEKQLIYNGKSGNTIKFSYREFINDTARPAFSQDLQYDLSESNVIGFKGMRIEVIKATNTNITYKILNDFTQ